MSTTSAKGVSNDTILILPHLQLAKYRNLEWQPTELHLYFNRIDFEKHLQTHMLGGFLPLVGYFAGLSSVAISRIASQFGFDIVVIDWEHSSLNVETMTQMVHDVQFMSEGNPLRLFVPGHEHATIGFALDAGASIIVPQVDTVEQARRVVSASKYGRSINGRRSAPPERLMPGMTDTCLDPSITINQNLNRQAGIIIQIESLEGIKNLDAILTAVGDQIDSVWLGSLDVRVSMDFPSGGVWGDEKEFVDAVALYESTLRKHNKPASGLALGPQAMKEIMARGRSFIVTTSDMYSLMGAAMQDLGEVRAGFPAMDYSDVYKAL